MEQAVTQRTDKKRKDIMPAGGFAEDRDVIWISAEFFNIILHPFQCLNNIQRSEIGTAVEAFR